MRFDPDLSKAHAGFPILERGEYQIEITGVKGYYRIKDNGEPSAGVRLGVMCVGIRSADGSLDTSIESAGEQISPHMLWVHTKKAYGMTKQVILAAMGYALDEERKANDEYFDGSDFSFEVDDSDPENVEIALGDSWDNLVGKPINVTADVRIWEGKPQQDYRAFSPVR